MSASTTNLPASPSPVWKDEVSARLHAHRRRRSGAPEDQPALPGLEPSTPSAIAARVADRYSRVPSWREAMAAEAAARLAAAAPPAVAPDSPRKLFEEREAAAETPDISPKQHFEAASDDCEFEIGSATGSQLPDIIRYSVSVDSLPAPRTAPVQARAQRHNRAAEFIDLAAEILEDPIVEATVEPTSPLPARLIEFPRELVAPRKARPRLAEGPLLEELLANPEPVPPQARLFDSGDLRILEADPEPRRSSVSERTMIHLDTEKPMREPQVAATPFVRTGAAMHVAPVQDRFLAAIVDAGLTLLAFLAFVLVFAVCTTHPPGGKAALAGSGATLLAMWVLYQFLFFSLSAATPGMRYAKIALCTFDDENPTPPAVRGRIAALLLSALPLGLGFLWAIFDEDGLSWHDRITQTYQRSYRGI